MGRCGFAPGSKLNEMRTALVQRSEQDRTTRLRMSNAVRCELGPAETTPTRAGNWVNISDPNLWDSAHFLPGIVVAIRMT